MLQENRSLNRETASVNCEPFQRSRNRRDAGWRVRHTGLVQVPADLHPLLVRSDGGVHPARPLLPPQSPLAHPVLGDIRHQVSTRILYWVTLTQCLHVESYVGSVFRLSSLPHLAPPQVPRVALGDMCVLLPPLPADRLPLPHQPLLPLQLQVRHSLGCFIEEAPITGLGISLHPSSKGV